MQLVAAASHQHAIGTPHPRTRVSLDPPGVWEHNATRDCCKQNPDIAKIITFWPHISHSTSQIPTEQQTLICKMPNIHKSTIPQVWPNIWIRPPIAQRDISEQIKSNLCVFHFFTQTIYEPPGIIWKHMSTRATRALIRDYEETWLGHQKDKYEDKKLFENTFKEQF